MTEVELRQTIADAARHRLTVLDLTNQGLVHLPADVGQLTSLLELRLEDNQLTSLPEEIGHLTNLTKLHLGQNEMTALPGEIRRLTKLTELTLHANQLTALPAEIGQLRRLRLLGAGSNRLRSLPPEIGELPELEELFLDNNQLGALPSTIGRLRSLTRLDLARNNLTSLPREIGELTKLKTLGVGGNRLTSVPPEIGQLASLVEVFLDNNQLVTVPPEIGQLRQLTRLEIFQNQLCAVPAELSRITRLRTLHLAHNRLAVIPKDIGMLKSLRVLRLEGNPITSLPAELGRVTGRDGSLAATTGLVALQTLDVSNTLLADVTPLTGLTTLQTLDLSQTQVADVSPLAHLAALQTLNLAGTRTTDISPLRGLIAADRPVRWASTVSGPGIYIAECPLVSPPPEIARQGNDAILNYFRDRETGGVDHLYKAKLLIVGDPGAGKTSLIRRLYRPGVTVAGRRRHDERHRHTAARFHVAERAAVPAERLGLRRAGDLPPYTPVLSHPTIAVRAARRHQQGRQVDLDPGFKYWLEVIDVFGGRSPVLVFQNEKADRSKAIDLAGIQSQDRMSKIDMQAIWHGGMRSTRCGRESSSTPATSVTSAKSCPADGWTSARR